MTEKDKELTELRAKLAEQEAKYTTLLNQRYEDMTEFRFRGKTAAELTKILARYEAAEAELAAPRERERSCICKGNWQEIVADHEGLIGKVFFDRLGREFKFVGIVHGADDYYYGMYSKEHGLWLLSCVSDIKGWDLKALSADPEVKS